MKALFRPFDALYNLHFFIIIGIMFHLKILFVNRLSHDWYIEEPQNTILDDFVFLFKHFVAYRNL